MCYQHKRPHVYADLRQNPHKLRWKKLPPTSSSATGAKVAPTDIKFSDAKEGALVIPRKIKFSDAKEGASVIPIIKFSNARSSSATLNNAKVTHKFTTAITTFPWSFLGSSHESDSGLLLVRVSLFLLPQSHSGGGVGTGFVSCFHSFLLSAFRCPNEDSTVNPTLPDDVTCRHTGADFLMVSHFP